MKPFSRALLAALVLLLGACEDPLDRMQGEPGEDNNFYTGEYSNEDSDAGEASSEAQNEAGEDHSEGAVGGEDDH